MRNSLSHILPAAALALVIPAASPTGASEYTLKVLHSFCVQPNCEDGQAPQGDLAIDSHGNLFGTTAAGGDEQGDGVVFELKHDKKAHRWIYKRLYTFCRQTPCADGRSPKGHLVVAANGDIYGVTGGGGGSGNGGTVFRLSNASGKWMVTTLHTFCPDGTNCSDGATPSVGLTYEGAASGALYDGSSPLYGVAGGGSKNAGVAYQIAPTSKGWKERVIYDFCMLANCTDGNAPNSVLLTDASGNLFGTTELGGMNSTGGTIFELKPKRKANWAEVVIHNFCYPYPCTMGTFPEGGLAMDASGSLLGTTVLGGPNTGYDMEGVLFRLMPSAKRSTYSVLYDFCSESNCADGASPWNGVALDGNGTVFGVTRAGGNLDPVFNETSGVAFKRSGSHYEVIYTFCSEQPNCADGAEPWSNLLIDKRGNLFGVAEVGGAFDGGAVYELSP